MAVRQWTLELRKQQSLKIKQWQPWQHSTGDKTIEGKAKHHAMLIKAVNGNKLKMLISYCVMQKIRSNLIIK